MLDHVAGVAGLVPARTLPGCVFRAFVFMQVAPTRLPAAIAEIFIRRTFRVYHRTFAALSALVLCPGHGTKIAAAGRRVDRVDGASGAAQMILVLFDRLATSASGDTR